MHGGIACTAAARLLADATHEGGVYPELAAHGQASLVSVRVAAWVRHHLELAMNVRRDNPQWTDYQPCPTCGSITGKPCVSFRRGFAGQQKVIPHEARRYKTLRGGMCLEPTRMRGVQVLCVLTKNHDAAVPHETKDGRTWPST